MHDRIDASKVVGAEIANVHSKVCVRLLAFEEVTPVVEAGIEADDVMPSRSERRNGDRSDVAVMAGYEDFHDIDGSDSGRARYAGVKR